MKRLFSLLLVLLALPAFAQNNPKANPSAVVEFGNARFTVLTDRLVRMEWASDGVFEDRASLAIVNRDLPVPSFTSSVKGGELVIKTGKLTLRYKGGRFSADNLSVRHGMGTWVPGLSDAGNLLGTVR
ncbi:MAG TPA: glycosyl hydrolase family 31, partial [Rikenellaceae bacterium]|nr:glycosyl hydrolase family 31 [Rikenellaceae bacterium]